jgi:hypothetical protein
MALYEYLANCLLIRNRGNDPIVVDGKAGCANCKRSEGSVPMIAPAPTTTLTGQIWWLPPLDNVGGSGDLLQPGCYGHPVVVLSPEAKGGEVAIHIITSFGGTDLAARHPLPRRRRDYLPIAPPPAHPDNGKLP